MATSKENALSALETAQKIVDSPEQLHGVRLAQLRGLLDYMHAEVLRIEETKRPRRKSKEAF